MSDQDDFLDGVASAAPFSSVSARRRRTFLAVRRDVPSGFSGASSVSEEENIPVLTEVVLADRPAGPPNDVPSIPLDSSRSAPMIAVETGIEELAEEMVRAIGEQMAYELPTLIEAVLLNAGAELRNGITATMETALRDYLAQRRRSKASAEGLGDCPGASR